ncbi:MAG: hypothetical protein ACE5HU_08040 [Acidobacteriota bacterium]
MKEIVAGIHAWSVFNNEKKIDFNGHLVANDEGCVLIDPPEMSEEELRMAEEIGPPGLIVITNRHHTRAAMELAARWKIRILMHEDDAQEILDDVRLGGIYRDGDRLTAGLLVVTLPDQKSPGESALICKKSDAVILGDALIGTPSGKVRMLPEEKYADVYRARAGLRRLLDHPFDAVLLGDGVSPVKGGRRVLEEFLGAA